VDTETGGAEPLDGYTVGALRALAGGVSVTELFRRLEADPMAGPEGGDRWGSREELIEEIRLLRRVVLLHLEEADGSRRTVARTRRTRPPDAPPGDGRRP
jgi:hypothetical protein